MEEKKVKYYSELIESDSKLLEVRVGKIIEVFFIISYFDDKYVMCNKIHEEHKNK